MTRTAHSPFIFVWFGLVLIASVGLYRTSDRVRHLDFELRQINASIESEHQRLHVLKTEWTYLSNPARLEAAAKKHLALRPTALQQITSLDRAASVLSASTREAAATMAKASAPPKAVRAANLRHAVVRTSALAVASAYAPRSEQKTQELAKDSAANAAAKQTPESATATNGDFSQTASVQPLPDSINALLEHMEAHP